MFWRAIGFVMITFGFMVWGLAQYRWTERMLARVNQTRPPDDQLRFWGISYFDVFDLHQQLWRIDPKGYARAMLGFVLSGLVLLGLAVWLTNGLETGALPSQGQPRRW